MKNIICMTTSNFNEIISLWISHLCRSSLRCEKYFQSRKFRLLGVCCSIVIRLWRHLFPLLYFRRSFSRWLLWLLSLWTSVGVFDRILRNKTHVKKKIIYKNDKSNSSPKTTTFKRTLDDWIHYSWIKKTRIKFIFLMI